MKKIIARWLTRFPTDPFTILKPENLSIDISKIHEVLRSTDFEAKKRERIGRVARPQRFRSCDAIFYELQT